MRFFLGIAVVACCAAAVLTVLTYVRPLCGAPPASANPPPQTTEERINAVLDRPITGAYQATPLEEVLQSLSEKTGLPIMVDKRALNDVGLDPQVPVSFFAKDSDLRPALRRMLAPTDLAFVVRDEVLLITTPDEAYSRLVQRVYALPKAIEAAPADERELHARQLLAAILETVAPTTWDDVGGPGEASLFRGRLLVDQTEEVHGEIAKLIELLDRAAQPPAGASLATPSLLAHRSKTEERILAALDKEVAFEFRDEPLDMACRQIATSCDIPVEFDRKALAEVGIGTDVPVTFQLRRTSLRSFLRHMLKHLDLTYLVRDDVLLITTPKECNCKLATRIYPIADLVRFDPAERAVAAGDKLERRRLLATGAEELIAILQRQVAPTTWEQVGGPGVMTALVYPPVLVISTADDTHRELGELLTRFRKSFGSQRPPEPQPVERVYVFLPPVRDAPANSTPTAIEIAALIHERIEPASWKGEAGKPAAGSIRPVAGRLIVRHRPAVQERIEKLLVDLQLIAPRPPLTDDWQRKNFQLGTGINGTAF